MATITLRGNPVKTSGELPNVGEKLSIKLTDLDLREVTLADFAGKKKVLNIFPSVDTPTCATSVRTFNKEATDLGNTVVLNIAADLPFALKRFCGAEGITNAHSLSTFRNSFAKDLGLEIIDGPLAGLCSRVVIVLDENDVVLYTEQVGDIADEPNYKSAISHLKA
ncbi:thiol peroxidase [Bacteriovorax sp. BSW11_IV]|uniref:thiol peroxidase n=1 Tax=Bacteriovorax sp. BSW11_IV TaxID=1353529 RepID=UPI000389DDB9|nr:thiol peroxidase [Bacteriovorax sp. BSW11_IV]EQC45037.1 thiol peroxidase [Bacteriovorax sp. BSW11_IV]